MTATRRLLLASALALPFVSNRATAQGVPSRPITLTVPFAAGGPTDLINRLVAEGMARDLGQSVVVENVTGAGGTLAAARVAQARPDGTTLLGAPYRAGHRRDALPPPALQRDGQLRAARPGVRCGDDDRGASPTSRPTDLPASSR